MFKSRSDVDCEKTKVELQGKIDDLNTVQNDRNELERLENRLPELQSELDTQEASVESADVKVDTATNKDDKLQTEVENLEEATRIAKQLVTAMESLEKINKEKVVESSKVRGPGTTVLSIDELNAILESEAEKKKSNDAKLREIDQQMFAYEREVSALDTKIMQATHEVQQIKATVSKREDLEKRRIDLQAEMDEHEVTISTAMVSVRPLEDQITKLKADTTRATKELQRMSSIAEQGYQEMCRQADRYQEVITQLQRFDAAKNSQLVEINRQATIQLQSKVEKHSALLEELSTKLAKARESLSNQAIYKKDIEANLRLRKEKKEQQAVTERIDELTVKLNASKRDEMYDKHQHLVEELEQNQRSAQRLDGVLEEIRNSIRGTDNMLNAELYRDIDKRCINEKATMESLTAVEKELGEYYKLFDDAIMQYHRLKMKEINKVIAELWTSTYTGTDIDTIEINSESDGSVSAARRTYNYRVVMRKGTADLDMKGRCSAGQKVLASLVIRLALAETFCINCGIIALDEPTANLDKLNLKNFAESLNNIIDTRRRQKNFQMIIITHDKDFLQVIGQYQKIEKYLKVYRDERQKTKVVEADLWES
ncbi:hypothetical protein SARC_01287 [Sphaeroforma arctica JP610]|uniref:DNA repair protein RAD50 n=1 Tax=Sphaeroforma arctica JP610 TaxID=667725 RepID=A0A0L0GCE4_9EUKA|nr:hypothetical protein SARC_01287 [Sphaeroforma arctica JP610]KNC86564.1 hypothetical protein SARC_01287 [Sphaeroforma arctica JP610]|eukprot:XP_014160466.1 hypothetical protein SARC_01287 [Sphaeroforma arctica JP610]